MAETREAQGCLFREHRGRLGTVAAVALALAVFLSVPAVAPAQSVSIAAGPSPWTNATSASFRLTADEPTEMECRLRDLGTWETCADGHTIDGPLAEGKYVLDVRAANGSGTPEDSWAWGVDLTPPAVARMHRTVGLWQSRRVVPLSWGATDALSGVGNVDVRYDTWNAAGDRRNNVAWLTDTKVSGAALVGGLGRTYCLSARSEDRARNLAVRWSRRRCVAVPLDDRALERKGAWKRRVGSPGYFLESFLGTRERGAWIRKSVAAKSLVLLATRCPRCGSVAIRWRGRVIDRVNLHARSSTRSARIPIASFPGLRRGTVRVEVTSSNELIRIDGLGVSAV
jgi:hypothetical protein